MSGVSFEDVRRAQEVRDPNLAALYTKLTAANVRPVEPGQAEPAITLAKFVNSLDGYEYRFKMDDAQRAAYRRQMWSELESAGATAAPERLRLHELIMDLWQDPSLWARETLLQLIAEVPLCWGPWKAFKRIFKEAEARQDYEVFGALVARLDVDYAVGSRRKEVSYYTIRYLLRRAWRYLARLSRSMPSVYVEAAVEVLRFYRAIEGLLPVRNARVASRIFFDCSPSDGGGYVPWSYELTSEHMAMRHNEEAWQLSSRPLFSLLERAQCDIMRSFAIEGLKKDFVAELRQIDVEWVLRLAGVHSVSTDGFVAWLLAEIPKFEAASLRKMGLHDVVLSLLDSPSDSARSYAISYASVHARDMPLEQLERYASHYDDEVRRFAHTIIKSRDPRKEIGLEAWGRMLGLYYTHELAAKALKKHFGATEMTPEWLRSLLLVNDSSVFGFAVEILEKVHSVKKLGDAYFISVFDDERVTLDSAQWALEQLREHGDLTKVSQDVWRRAYFNPCAQSVLHDWFEEDVLKPRALGVDFWRALAHHPTFEADAWLNALKQRGEPWSEWVAFDEYRAHAARERLSDVRQFSAQEIGFEWLMTLVDSRDPADHDFAVAYLSKALKPADFAPATEASASAAAATPSTVDLRGLQFLFTGEMATMDRDDAQAEVVRLGGVNAKSVTKTLDYLVVGDEGSALFGNGKKGSKILKAEEYQQKGLPVRIISETAFLQMLAGGAPSEDNEAQSIAGSEVLWEMATSPGDELEPRRQFALHFLRMHHEDIYHQIEERHVDPGAEIPKSFLTFERIQPLFADPRPSVRRLAVDFARWELARWAPTLEQLRALLELPYKEVRELIALALTVEERKDTKPYRLSSDIVTVDGVYALCESPQRATRALGMELIARHPRLAHPQSLFRLAESPDRQMRAFVIRAIWKLYRDRGVSAGWTPTPIEVRYAKIKTKKGVVEAQTGPGVAARPEGLPAAFDELREFLRHTLYGLPPAKPEERAVLDGQQMRPITGRRAKIELIEVLRDLGLEDAQFAALLAPLLKEFMGSRGKSEREACLVALVRLQHTHGLQESTLGKD